MAFIGESRIDTNSPWKLYVCLDAKECEMIMDAVGKSVGRRLKTYNYYKDLVDGGEATTKQQDKLVEAEENFDAIVNVHAVISEYIKFRKS